jgi:hypothetical protein
MVAQCRYGSFASYWAPWPDVRSYPNNDQTGDTVRRLKRANKRHQSRMAAQSAGIVN